MIILRLAAALFSLLLMATSSEAHQTTLAYVSVDRNAANLHVDLTMAFRDLDVAVGVDDNFDGLVTWREASGKLDQIGEVFLRRQHGRKHS